MDSKKYTRELRKKINIIYKCSLWLAILSALLAFIISKAIFLFVSFFLFFIANLAWISVYELSELDDD